MSCSDNGINGVSVHAGFPNAADDSRLQALDLNRLVVEHPNSTFYFRVAGDEWNTQGVFHGDIAVVDRGLDPRPSDIVAWWRENQFALSVCAHIPGGATVWGVVTATIHQFRKANN